MCEYGLDVRSPIRECLLLAYFIGQCLHCCCTEHIHRTGSQIKSWRSHTSHLATTLQEHGKQTNTHTHRLHTSQYTLLSVTNTQSPVWYVSHTHTHTHTQTLACHYQQTNTQRAPCCVPVNKHTASFHAAVMDEVQALTEVRGSVGRQSNRMRPVGEVCNDVETPTNQCWSCLPL